MKLFHDDLPEGLIYTPLWINKHAQSNLIQLIDSNRWNIDIGRRTQHYGRRYNYNTGRVDGPGSAEPLTDLFAELAERLYEERVMSQIPEQVIVNEYLVNEESTQGIAAHKDHVRDFGPVVVTLSLIEEWNMRFTREGYDPVEFPLEPGSIAVLTGEARYEWDHSIPARKYERDGGIRVPRNRRISVTFRTVQL